MSHETLTYPLKRGDVLSFALSVILPAPTGAWHCVSQVRDSSGALVESFTTALTPAVTPGSTATTGTLVCTSAQTADWPVENLQADVRFYDEAVPPVVITFPTYVIKVAKEKSSVS